MARGADGEPQARRGAVPVLDDVGAARHEALAPVDLGHLEAAAREPRAQPLHDRCVLVERHVERASDRLPGDVVLGRSQAPGEHDEVRPREPVADDARQLVHVVAHDHLAADVEPTSFRWRDGEGVRVGAERREQLTADRDDAGDHTQPDTSSSAEREVGVDSGHGVVGHHAQAAVERLEAVRRIGLHDVGRAEQEEARQRAAPPHRVEQQGDEHADDLVEDHLTGVGLPKWRSATLPAHDPIANSPTMAAGEGRRGRQEPPEQQPRRRAEGARREADIADTEHGSERQRTTGREGESAASTV